MFGGDGRLVFQKGADGGIAPAHGEARHRRLGRGRIHQQAAQQAGPEPAGAPQKTARRKMLSQEGAGLAGLALIYAVCLLIGRLVARKRSA